MRSMFATALVTAVLAGLPAPATAVAADRPAPPRITTTAVRLQPGTPDAVTYRPDLAPPGARVSVVGFQASTGTAVLLGVRGLVPGREYGAHVHVNGCGPDPADAGPHYQHRPDPRQPSTDPAYANPRNEVWLDLTTDRRGDGVATATVSWVFPDHRPRAVVLHERHTETGPGVAGTAGERLACVTVGL